VDETSVATGDCGQKIAAAAKAEAGWHNRARLHRGIRTGHSRRRRASPRRNLKIADEHMISVVPPSSVAPCLAKSGMVGL